MALAEKLTALAEKVDTCEANAIAYAKDQIKLQLSLTQLESKFDADATKKAEADAKLANRVTKCEAIAKKILRLRLSTSVLKEITLARSKCLKMIK